MNIEIEPDLAKVIQFMEREIPAVKLVWVAENLAPIARVLWSHHKHEHLPRWAAAVERAPISSCE